MPETDIISPSQFTGRERRSWSLLDSLWASVIIKLIETKIAPQFHRNYDFLRASGIIKPTVKLLRGAIAWLLTNVICPELCQTALQNSLASALPKKLSSAARGLCCCPGSSRTALLRQYPRTFSLLSIRICLVSPSGPISLSSPFFIEYPAIEAQIYEEICKTRALSAIQSTLETGKPHCWLNYANCQGCHAW